MDTTTLELILVFLFATIALLALGAASFTRLVALILSNGSKVEALLAAHLQALTALSNGKAQGTTSHLPESTPIMPDDQSTP